MSKTYYNTTPHVHILDNSFLKNLIFNDAFLYLKYCIHNFDYYKFNNLYSKDLIPSLKKKRISKICKLVFFYFEIYENVYLSNLFIHKFYNFLRFWITIKYLILRHVLINHLTILCINQFLHVYNTYKYYFFKLIYNKFFSLLLSTFLKKAYTKILKDVQFLRKETLVKYTDLRKFKIVNSLNKSFMYGSLSEFIKKVSVLKNKFFPFLTNHTNLPLKKKYILNSSVTYLHINNSKNIILLYFYVKYLNNIFFMFNKKDILSNIYLNIYISFFFYSLLEIFFCKSIKKIKNDFKYSKNKFYLDYVHLFNLKSFYLLFTNFNKFLYFTTFYRLKLLFPFSYSNSIHLFTLYTFQKTVLLKTKRLNYKNKKKSKLQRYIDTEIDINNLKKENKLLHKLPNLNNSKLTNINYLFKDNFFLKKITFNNKLKLFNNLISFKKNKYYIYTKLDFFLFKKKSIISKNNAKRFFLKNVIYIFKHFPVIKNNKDQLDFLFSYSNKLKKKKLKINYINTIYPNTNFHNIRTFNNYYNYINNYINILKSKFAIY